MSYTKKVLEGLGSQFAYRGVAAGLSLLKLAVIARLLTPTQFGIFSLVTIALGVTEAAAETGINLTILQSKKPITYFLDTAWVISIIRGFVIALVMVVIGYFMSQYYQDVELTTLVAIAAIIPMIRGFINPSIVTMQKELQFISDSLFRISLTIVESIAAMALVWFTGSVVGLIGAMILSAIWEVLLTFILFKNKPRFKYHADRATSIFNNTKWLNASAILSYLQENLDNLLIGSLLGTTRLGYYDLGYKLSHKSQEVARATHFSTLPVYIRVKNDQTRLKRAVLRTLLSTMAILGAAGLPLLLYPQITVWLFGSQWEPVVPIIPYLTLAGLLHSFSVLSYTLFLSREQYSRISLHLFSSTVLMAGLVWYLSGVMGLVGAALAILLARVITLPLVLYGLWKNLRHE